MEDANSTEVDETCQNPAVIFMPEGSTTHMGGTMRLGLRATKFERDCLARRLYGDVPVIHERHRHRYEVCRAWHDGGPIVRIWPHGDGTGPSGES